MVVGADQEVWERKGSPLPWDFQSSMELIPLAGISPRRQRGHLGCFQREPAKVAHFPIQLKPFIYYSAEGWSPPPNKCYYSCSLPIYQYLIWATGINDLWCMPIGVFPHPHPQSRSQSLGHKVASFTAEKWSQEDVMIKCLYYLRICQWASIRGAWAGAKYVFILIKKKTLIALCIFHHVPTTGWWGTYRWVTTNVVEWEAKKASPHRKIWRSKPFTRAEKVPVDVDGSPAWHKGAGVAGCSLKQPHQTPRISYAGRRQWISMASSAWCSQPRSQTGIFYIKGLIHSAILLLHLCSTGVVWVPLSVGEPFQGTNHGYHL